MGSEIQTVIVAACVLSAICALISTMICVWMWHSVREQIKHGDDGVKDHGERSLAEIRGAVGRIEANSIRRELQIDEMQEAIARIEATSEVDGKHVLRARDLGVIHEKVNTIAQNVAELRGQQAAQHNALREQLKVLQETFMRQSMYSAHQHRHQE